MLNAQCHLKAGQACYYRGSRLEPEQRVEFVEMDSRFAEWVIVKFNTGKTYSVHEGCLSLRQTEGADDGS